MPTFNKRTESSLITAIGGYLQNLENADKIVFWSRQQAGNITTKGSSGKFYRIRQGREGISDLWVILNDGRMIWIEGKLDEGKQSSGQIEFQLKVEEVSHFYWVIRSLDDLQKRFIMIGVVNA